MFGIKIHIQYLLFFLCFATTFTASGQIIYNPTVISGNTAEIIVIASDIGETDNNITIAHTGVALNIYGSFGHVELLGNGAQAASAFGDDITIDGASLIFYPLTLSMTNTTNTIGQWYNLTDQYIGFRLPIGGQFHYGWLRMSTVVTGSSIDWTVNGYAYNSVAGESIDTGEETLNTNVHSFKNEIHFVSRNKEVRILNLSENSNYSIFSILGREVKSGLVQKNRNYIVTDNLTSGMYIIKLEGTDTGNTITRKILVQ